MAGSMFWSGDEAEATATELRLSSGGDEEVAVTGAGLVWVASRCSLKLGLLATALQVSEAQVRTVRQRDRRRPFRMKKITHSTRIGLSPP